jgi:hypothetical protein
MVRIPFTNIEFGYRPPMWARSIGYKASKKFGKRGYAYQLLEQQGTKAFAEEMAEIHAELKEEKTHLDSALKDWEGLSKLQSEMDTMWTRVPSTIAANAQKVLDAQVTTQEKLLAIEKTQAKLDQRIDNVKQTRKLRKESKYRKAISYGTEDD